LRTQGDSMERMCARHYLREKGGGGGVGGALDTLKSREKKVVSRRKETAVKKKGRERRWKRGVNVLILRNVAGGQKALHILDGGKKGKGNKEGGGKKRKEC